MAGIEIKPLYVLHGGDAFLVDTHRRAIVNAIAEGGDPQLCTAVFEGGRGRSGGAVESEEGDSDAASTAAAGAGAGTGPARGTPGAGAHSADLPLADVLDELRTASLLAPHRLVIVRNADAFVSAHREKLESFFQSPPTRSSLMLIVASWPGNTRLAKLAARIGLTFPCSSPEGDLAGWLGEAAGRRDKKLTADACELLTAWVGRDLSGLDTEVEKLSLYVGDRDTIDVPDVEAIVTSSAGPGAFALTNALTLGDCKAALEAMTGMLHVRGEEFRALGMIGWHLRRVLAAREQIDAGATPQQATPKMPYQAIRDFQNMLRRRSAASLRRDFRALLRADLAMKSGTPSAAALQQLLLEICK
jgi:DNA polymerase-3 subunit delta